jgi:methyl-accepting chemotaxis protein
VKLTNLTITPKLVILVGVTLLGLCAAGVLAGYLMQREMLNARIDQTKAIVEMGLNMAAGLKKQVDAGEMTREVEGIRPPGQFHDLRQGRWLFVWHWL